MPKYGGKIVANNYLLWWDIPIQNERNLIENIANSYSNTYLNRSIQQKLRDFERDFKRYNIDGVIIHINSSCKRDSIISKEFVELLKNKGIPTVEINGDICDSNKFQEDQSLNRIEAFLEN